MSTLRLLSYNVRALKDDAAAVAAVVRACDPDVVCIQEAPRFFRWRTRCATLASDCGLFYVTGSRRTGGAVLMAHLRVDVGEAREGMLTKHRGLHQRGIAGALVTKGGVEVLVVSAHLGLDAAERVQHAGEVLDLLGQSESRHVVLAGDLNSRPGSEPWRVLHAGGLRDGGPDSGPTFSATDPRKRIDAVLVSPDVGVLDYRVVHEPGVERATDHLPVLAVLDLPEA